MYTVIPVLYKEVAERLCEAIGRDGYFSGCVEFPFGDVDCKLTASIVVCRKRLELPEGTVHPIDDLVPVWWSFSTARDGVELLNDFSFSELREFL